MPQATYTICSEFNWRWCMRYFWSSLASSYEIIQKIEAVLYTGIDVVFTEVFILFYNSGHCSSSSDPNDLQNRMKMLQVKLIN